MLKVINLCLSAYKMFLGGSHTHAYFFSYSGVEVGRSGNVNPTVFEPINCHRYLFGIGDMVGPLLPPLVIVSYVLNAFVVFN